METRFIEVTNGDRERPFNWGKFMLGRFTNEEWHYRDVEGGSFSLIGGRGWTADHLLVLDLQTGEGAIFKPGGYAKADLDKHKIWVCPLFEPFLTWLYTQDLRDLTALPAHVHLPDAPTAMTGYRRAGVTPSGPATEDDLR